MCVLGGKAKGNYGDGEKAQTDKFGETHTHRAQKDKGAAFLETMERKKVLRRIHIHFTEATSDTNSGWRVKGVSRRRISGTGRHEIRRGTRVISSVSWKTAAGKRRETHIKSRAWEIGKGGTHMELFFASFRVNHILVKVSYNPEIWQEGIMKWIFVCTLTNIKNKQTVHHLIVNNLIAKRVREQNSFSTVD